MTLKTLARRRTKTALGHVLQLVLPTTGAKLTNWPVNGEHRPPVPVQRRQRLAGRRAQIVIDQVPSLADEAHRVLDPMDFGYYYNPAENQIRGGFWLTERPGRCKGNYRGG